MSSPIRSSPRRLRRLAKVPLDHPWFARGAPPVFWVRPTDAAEVRRLDPGLCTGVPSHDARLVILGEGEERLRLQALVRELDSTRWCPYPASRTIRLPICRERGCLRSRQYSKDFLAR